MNADNQIRANSVLPAVREPIRLLTSDGVELVGELALPVDRAAAGLLVCVHPLPTHGGMMDSHLYRKAAWRLPALADLAVLRFNTRGTASAAGRSGGSFDQGGAEGLDLAAAVAYGRQRGLSVPWLVGWSFGTDVILRNPPADPFRGVVLISPPLHSTTDEQLAGWARRSEPVIALVPEHDDYLQPPAARARFASLPNARVIAGENAKHLWIGEESVRFVLDRIVEAVNPVAIPPGQNGLPTTFDGPMERWTDL